jgi:hypothetical protein
MRRVMFSLSPFESSLLDVPRAHRDPICSLIEALSVVALATERPIRHSTTALLLDAQQCGIGLVRTRLPHRDATHFIISEASRMNNANAVFVVTTRPQQTVQFTDGDDFLSMFQLFTHAGITLTEWVVLGQGGLYCPRALTDIPSHWATRPHHR